MTKMDLKVGWNATVNIGNYSNIQPYVEINLKDVDSTDKDIPLALSNLVSSLWMIQVHNLLSEVDTALSLNPRGRYFDELKGTIENIHDDFRKAVDELGIVTMEGIYGKSEFGGG